MARARKISRMHFALLALVLFLGVFAAPLDSCSATCGEGTGVPPFLGSQTVIPNIMLMIDNSASMYDLGYLEDVGQCTDESYNGIQDVPGVYNKAYAGYFDQLEVDNKGTDDPSDDENISVWYYYDLVNEQFVATDAATASGLCTAATGTKYIGPDTVTTTPYVCVTSDKTTTPDTINAFAATGHFLNWAASSKMDIQKLILTGGT